jgi:hypothetical protein
VLHVCEQHSVPELQLAPELRQVPPVVPVVLVVPWPVVPPVVGSAQVSLGLQKPEQQSVLALQKPPPAWQPPVPLVAVVMTLALQRVPSQDTLEQHAASWLVQPCPERPQAAVARQ